MKNLTHRLKKKISNGDRFKDIRSHAGAWEREETANG